MTYLTPNPVLNLCANVVLQSIITITFNFSSIKVILHCFFFINIYDLVHIYIFYVSRFPNSSSICFSFNHNIPSLSIIFFIPFLSKVFLLYQPYLYTRFFFFFFISNTFSNFSLKLAKNQANSKQHPESSSFVNTSKKLFKM